MRHESGVSLRKFPYPYQAALSVCSDIDGTSLENFIAIHTFLNTDKETPLGKGLSLSIADSFWMFSSPQTPDHAVSYFQNTSTTPTPAAPIIRDFIRTGLIDVMHSYGNFAAGSDFSRHLAIQVLEELDRHGLKIKVWTNHGGSNNFQNIDRKTLGKGDLPQEDQLIIGLPKEDLPTDIGKPPTHKRSYYHSDLLLEYGVKFYWDSESSLTTIVGQDRSARLGEAYWESPLISGMNQKAKSLLKAGLSQADRFLFTMSHKHLVPWEVFDGGNDLISLDTLRDGRPIYRFKRFGHGRYDWSDDLPYLLNDRVLKRLVETEGYLILYVHIGDRRMCQDNLPLSLESAAALGKVAQLYREGILWVASTSTLLRYDLIFKTLNWSYQVIDGNLRIQINSLASPVYRDKLSVSHLSGLTFVVPDVERIELFLEGRPVPLNRNPEDSQGRLSVTVPLPALQWTL